MLRLAPCLTEITARLKAKLFKADPASPFGQLKSLLRADADIKGKQSLSYGSYLSSLSLSVLFMHTHKLIDLMRPSDKAVRQKQQQNEPASFYICVPPTD